MCTGLEVAGLAASAAGAGLGYKASTDAQGAMEDVMRRNAAYQQGLQQQATPIVQSNISKSTPLAVNQQLGAGKDAALAQYQKLQALPLGGAGLDAVPTSMTVNDRVKGFVGQQNDANARLQSYGAWQNQQGLQNSEVDRRLGLIGTQADWANQVLPLQLNRAQHSSDSLSGIGKILSALGAVGGAYGAVAPSAAANAGGSAFNLAGQGYNSPAFQAFSMGGRVPSSAALSFDALNPYH